MEASSDRALQDLMADRGVCLDDPVLVGGQPSGLVQDGVGDADLADVVHLGREPQQRALFLVLAGAVGEDGAGAAHSLDMARGLVVAELGGQRQAVDGLLLGGAQIVLGALEAVDGLSQLGCALVDPPLEGLAVQAQLHVQGAGVEQVGHAGEHLLVVEGLEDEVLGDAPQRRPFALAADVGGEHENREVVVGVDQRRQPLHDREAVQDGHVEVEQDQVGPDLCVERLDPGGVGGGVNLSIAGQLEQLFEHPHVAGFVVDDQDSVNAGGRVAHEAGSWGSKMPSSTRAKRAMSTAWSRGRRRRARASCVLGPAWRRR